MVVLDNYSSLERKLLKGRLTISCRVCAVKACLSSSSHLPAGHNHAGNIHMQGFLEVYVLVLRRPVLGQCSAHTAIHIRVTEECLT